MRQAFELAWANAHVFGKENSWFSPLTKCSWCLLNASILKANVVPGVSTWTTSGSELLLRLELCSTSTHRSAMFKYVLSKINVAFDLHYACRITTSRQECLQRWWIPRLGRCPSPTSFTSPSLPRRRRLPSLCQRLTMRWKIWKQLDQKYFWLQAMMYLTGRRHFKACTNLWKSPQYFKWH